jgi:hypothetical protein
MRTGSRRHTATRSFGDIRTRRRRFERHISESSGSVQSHFILSSQIFWENKQEGLCISDAEI